MEEKEPKKIIGLMSGTSCDSIDAGLCEVYPDMSVSLLKGINFPYPEHIREKIFSTFRGEISIKELCQLNFAVGKCFADASNVLIKQFGKPDFIASHGRPDVIITDPPRAGMHPDVIKVIMNAAPKRIVYVSCNPATQARDLQLLDPLYKVEKVQPVDMFPHTPHVENVVMLKLKVED